MHELGRDSPPIREGLPLDGDTLSVGQVWESDMEIGRYDVPMSAVDEPGDAPDGLEPATQCLRRDRVQQSPQDTKATIYDGIADRAHSQEFSGPAGGPQAGRALLVAVVAAW